MNAEAVQTKRTRRRKKPLSLMVIVSLMAVFVNIVGFRASLRQGLFLGDRLYTNEYIFFREGHLAGEGTAENPYRIRSVNDLEQLAIYVNTGTSFRNVWFRQECDLDFADCENWTPIGLYGTYNYFSGIYDGNGHRIRNITIDGTLLEGVYGPKNVGLFGCLAGTVCNLYIESGRIRGDCIGSIASAGTDGAMIVNCANSASLTAYERCGGIADDFGQGKIICCVNDGEMLCLNDDSVGGICSYSAGTVYGCSSAIQPFSEVFTGAAYRTREDSSDAYPQNASRCLEEAESTFAVELQALPLVRLD